MDLKKLFGIKKKDDASCDIQTVTLGKRLPWPEYHKTGDYSTVMLTPNGIRIIISLTDLTDVEEKAIGDDEFEIFLTPADCVPFLVLRFGNVFKTDLTINLRKITDEQFNSWINSDNNTIELILLEGSNATLRCLRYFDYTHMNMVRSICEGQKKYSSESIEYGITQVYNSYSVDDLIADARCIDYIPKVTYQL